MLWGTKGLKHYLSKREVSWLLWKQPTCHEIIDCFERDTMQQSLEHFPVNGTLDVCSTRVTVILKKSVVLYF